MAGSVHAKCSERSLKFVLEVANSVGVVAEKDIIKILKSESRCGFIGEIPALTARVVVQLVAHYWKITVHGRTNGSDVDCTTIRSNQCLDSKYRSRRLSLT